MKSIIKNEFNEHLKVTEISMQSLIDPIEKTSKLCINSLQNDGKILLFGNGGSAGDAQHIAAELVCRYKTERKGLSAIALTTDSSIITAIGNDYGFDRIFSRQIEALAKPEDIAIGISTGGTSINVINALKVANVLKCKTIGFSGRDGGKFNELCDINIVVPSYDTARIQEMHILIGHIICHLIEKNFTSN